ncbi:MAG: ADP-ribosylglycohydrolase family protein [Patescibacteria group bacterium]|nr:ADP-ribosylglycohydrolase family protein [Patescibacteria group bacterium]
MIHPNPNMLVYIGIADAYAAACEYSDDPAIKQKLLNGECYAMHPRHKHPPGNYTDDTEMSVANARVLIDYEFPFRPIQFADAYVNEFNRGGKRDGYARRFQDFLEHVSDGKDFLARIKPDSAKNGAAMRAVPIGVLPSVDMVLEAATIQAAITHNTPEGLFSARLVALMSHYSLYDSNSLSCVAAYCADHLPKEDMDLYAHLLNSDWPSTKPVTKTRQYSVGITTAHACVTLIKKEKSLWQMMQALIHMGGDTDSVAAIVWGVASARYQDEKIPLFLYADLEGGKTKTGTKYLKGLGTALMKKYSK